ncbi:T9SS type A sorting domain-containing protein [Hymenobacter metallilatus]|uniref:T9SS C-terminal target domain-containing protein n=1 Tax=Hymenobacter metallilatus TaxID=2493666 RepID=A0A3R9NM12_9BACT|nr:T9SS type A sorting domain-containing protein [Hymenobacter metallilatus]RSK37096.1 T9SS C-terminal target domain-containing protein [Hymenobacter metallilatus]
MRNLLCYVSGLAAFFGLLPQHPLRAQTISGTVFEDVNYGGGAGRPLGGTAGAVAVGRIAGTTTVTAGARVELYDGAGNFVATTTTSTAASPALGTYSFSTGLTAGATYTVRVTSGSVRSTRTGTTSGLLPVLTYVNGQTDRVGGQDPARGDAANGAGGTTLTSLDVATSGGTIGTLAQNVATVTATSGTVSGVDFGFSFDVIVNTNDAGLGSLRQFIANANALTGEASLAQSGFFRDAVAGNATPNTALPSGKETSIFMIPDGLAHPGLRAATAGGPASQLSSGVAVVAPLTGYSLLSTSTNLDGRTQSYNVGNTNAAVLGTGGTVGTSATTLSQLDGPEVQLSGPRLSGNGATINLGLSLSGANSGVFGLALVGFTGGDSDTQGALRLTGSSNITASQNVLGATATSFASPGAAARTTSSNLIVNSTTGSVVNQNLIGFGGVVGIRLVASAVSSLTISGNEVTSHDQDNLLVRGSTISISGNLITGASTGFGIDMLSSAGSTSILDNTISNNSGGSTGTTADKGGVRVFGTGNELRRNLISNNAGSGVLATFVTGSQTQNTILSQNSFVGNAFLGIDLVSTLSGGPTAAAQTQGVTPFVSVNADGKTTSSGANSLLNFPVLESATVVGTNLVVRGFAPTGATVEVYLASPGATNASTTAGIDTRNFGQGQTFLFGAAEGSGSDADGGTGSYSAPFNGFNQGTETGASRFSFTVPLASLPGGGAGLAAGSSLLTATATVVGTGTSEFGGNVVLNAPPVANNATNVQLSTISGTVALSPGLSGTASGPGNAVASYTILSLPSGGTLSYFDGTTTTPVAANQVILAANIGGLRYTPAAGTTGSFTFQFSVTDQFGTASTQNSTGGTLAAGPATYTLPVRAAADVATSITPTPAGSVNAGASLSFAVTFTNAGPDAATGYARTLTLTPGLGTGSNVTITGSGFTASYNNTSGAVTFTPSATSLASGANLNVTVTITAVPAALSAVTASTTTSTTADQGADVGPNSATATVTVTPIADVTTTLTAVTGQTQFLPGGTGVVTVNFRNAGPSSAADPTRTVTVPAGFTVVSAPGSTSVVGSTITYPAANPVGVSTAGINYDITLQAPTPTAQTDYTLSSLATTSTSQGTNALADQATLNLNVIGPNLGCTASFYRVRQPNGSNASVLERVDRTGSGSTITYSATPIYTVNRNGDVALNALSYNAADGYLYAVVIGSNRLYRLGLDSYQDLGPVAGLSSVNSASADAAGVLYLANDNSTTLFRLVVATRTLTTVTLPASVRVGDLALNPLDGLIYATRYYNSAGNNGLIRINPSTGATSTLAPSGTLTTTGQDVGALFFDAAGTLYAATNQGTLVLYSTADGSVTDIGVVDGAAQADGASCANPPQRLDVVRTASQPIVVARGSASSQVIIDVPFTVQLQNTSPVDAPVVQINDFLARVFTQGSPTLSIAVAPSVTGGILVANTGFTGQNGNSNLLTGQVALPSGASAIITYTLRLTYANTGAVPRTVINTQSLASTVGSSSNQGYTIVNSALVPPAVVLAVDQSTNSASLPASANADQASPTPVSFADTPLPVTLVSFRATVAASDALLTWATAAELRNDRFEVERSNDGRRFERVGTVAGRGTTSQGQQYSFRDAGVARLGQQLYYRLRQVDTDGTSSLSGVQVVAFSDAAASFNVAPNPATDQVTLTLNTPARTYTVVLFDVHGRELRQWQLGGGQQHPLPLSSLPTGVYLLRVAGLPGVQRLVKL